MFGSAKAEDYIATKVRHRVVAHLADGQSLRGVLAATHADCLVLEHVEALADGVATPADGQAVVPHANLSWLQMLAPEA